MKPYTAAIVVMEAGSEWPAWIEVPEASVIAQEEAESPRQLADRVIDHLESARARGAPVRFAVIACSERTDDGALAARRAAATAMLGTMAKAGGGRLLLSASKRSSGRARHALSSVATDLAQAWENAGVEVCVRIGTEARAPSALADRHHVA